MDRVNSNPVGGDRTANQAPFCNVTGRGMNRSRQVRSLRLDVTPSQTFHQRNIAFAECIQRALSFEAIPWIEEEHDATPIVNLWRFGKNRENLRKAG
jgi:hypothetical protein